jgi:hypothetical protein
MLTDQFCLLPGAPTPHASQPGAHGSAGRSSWRGAAGGALPSAPLGPGPPKKAVAAGAASFPAMRGARGLHSRGRRCPHRGEDTLTRPPAAGALSRRASGEEAASFEHLGSHEPRASSFEPGRPNELGARTTSLSRPHALRGDGVSRTLCVLCSRHSGVRWGRIDAERRRWGVRLWLWSGQARRRSPRARGRCELRAASCERAPLRFRAFDGLSWLLLSVRSLCSPCLRGSIILFGFCAACAVLRRVFSACSAPLR